MDINAQKKIIHMKNCHQQICKNLVLKFGKAFFGRNILQKIKNVTCGRDEAPFISVFK